MAELKSLNELGGLNLVDAALIAAGQASEAAAELIRLARDGTYGDGNSPFCDEEVVGKLAEALKLTIQLQGDPNKCRFLDEEERELVGQLSAALTRFLEGWVG